MFVVFLFVIVVVADVVVATDCRHLTLVFVVALVVVQNSKIIRAFLAAVLKPIQLTKFSNEGMEGMEGMTVACMYLYMYLHIYYIHIYI